MKETNIDWANLSFSYMPTDYNVRCTFKDGKWGEIEVSDSEYVPLHIAASCLHYGQESFEGLKAFRGKDGKVRVFRMDENAKRFIRSAEGIAMQPMPVEIFCEMVRKVVKLNERFVPPYGSGASLYIRPLQIGISARVGVKPASEYMVIMLVTPVGPYFKDGFSYQTGVGGASIASTISLSKIMEEKNIHMGLGVGGLTKPMCELLDRGLARKLVDTQDFDLDAVNNVRTNPNHFPISAGEYASPMNKGAFVNKLDYVILASLEVDTHFNCNVVVGSDGIITGAQGGHPDTAQGAKCTIVIAPLLQGRIPAICTDVTTVTTPGESVDIVVTDYGVAVNPKRPDLLKALQDADCVPLKTIEELRDIAYSIVGEPDKVQFGDRIVGIIEARDGTVMDVVREVKPFSFRED